MRFHHSVVLSVLGLICCSGLGGCCSCSSYAEPSPQDQILQANRFIEQARAFQRFAVFAAPLERKVEGLLHRDDRFESARFALEAYLYDIGTFYDFFDDHAPAGLSFDLVVATKVDMNQDEVSKSVITALREAEFRAQAPSRESVTQHLRARAAIHRWPVRGAGGRTHAPPS